MSDLPPGFELDTTSQDTAAPSGFVVDPKPRKDRTSPRSSVLNTLLQGATFGLSDEVAAGGAAAGRYLRSLLRDDKSASEAYSDAGAAYDRTLDRERADVAQFKEDNPVFGAALEIAGGFAGGAPGLMRGTAASTPARFAAAGLPPGPVARLGTSAAPASTARTVYQAGKAGAVAGGLGGFGSGEGSLENRVVGAGTGALLGGGLGATVPLAATLATRIGSRLLDAVGLRNPERGGDRQMLRAFERDVAGGGPSMDDVAAALARNKGPDTLPEIIPDLAGENVKNLARGITQVPGAARQTAQTFLQDRAKAQGNRIYNQVNRQLAPDEFYEAETKFLETLRNNANKFYDEARAATPYVWSKDLDAMFDRPTMKEALGSAMRKAADEGQPFGVGRQGGQFMRLEDFNKGDKIESLTLDAVDRVKRVLDQKIETQGKNEFTGKLNDDGRIWTKLKNDFLDAVGKADKSGKYAKARKQYAGDAEVLTALREGRDFFKLDPEQIAASVKDMSVAERDAFRSGIARAIRDKIRDAKDTADKTQRLFGDDTTRDQIRAAFDDDKAFKKFERMMRRESAMAETRGIAGPRTGPATARTGAEFEDMAIDPAGGFMSALLRGDVGGAAAAGLSGLMRRAQGINSSTADYLGPRMFNPAQQQNLDYIARLKALRQREADNLIRGQGLARFGMGSTGAAIGTSTDQKSQ